MILAEITAEGWTIIIGSATVGITTMVSTIVNLILGYLRENRQIARDMEVSGKVDEVHQQAKAAANTAADVKQALDSAKD